MPNPEQQRENYRTALAIAEAAHRGDGPAVAELLAGTPTAEDRSMVVWFLARLPSAMLAKAYGGNGKPIDIPATFRRLLDGFAAGLPDLPPSGQGT